MIDFKELVKAGVHFGHRTSVWCPRMEPYIWGHKNNVHLIDVSKTAFHLEKASQYLESIAAEGKTILWIGTKKAAQDVIRSVAEATNSPYVNHRWIGGTLSNFSQVKKSVTKLLHYQDVIAKDVENTFYTKKELNRFKKSIERLKRNIGGILNLRWPLGAVVIVDVNKEASALREASAMQIPVVALVDTNSDPSLVDYIIPGNDDAPRSIKLVIDYLGEAVKRGLEVAKVNQSESASQDSEEEENFLQLLPEEDEGDEGKRKGPRRQDAARRVNKRAGSDGVQDADKHHGAKDRPSVGPKKISKATNKN
jgi:small subunit ribosomal protein S2